MEIEVWKVDAFTDVPLTGNPAGIVLNADGLSDELMLKIASELNLSETAFVMRPTRPDADFRVRFFTPTTEVDLCGHATIAANFCLAEEGRIELKEPKTVVKQETNVGVLPVEIRARSGCPWLVVMTQAKPEVRPSGLSASEIAGALRVSEGVITSTGLPLQIASTGLPFLMVPLAELDTLMGLKPDLARVAELSERLGVAGFYAFTLEALEKSSTAHARCFAPYVGVSEDPVTGTASGALGAYLVYNSAVEVREPTTTMVVEQGHAMERPGKVHVEVGVSGGKPLKVRVGGRAVVSLRGKLRIS